MTRMLFALVAILLLLPSFPASASITQAIGGPGGARFRLDCPAGNAMVGIRARAGAWVDGVAPLCAAPIGPRVAVGWTGGTKSGVQEVYCPAGKFVSGLLMTFTRGNGLDRQFVNTIGVRCGRGDVSAETRCILSGDTFFGQMNNQCWSRSGKPGLLIGGGLLMADALDCPGDEVVTGLHGSSGSYLDAMGLVCDAAPTAQVMLPPVAPPRPTPFERPGTTPPILSQPRLAPTRPVPFERPTTPAPMGRPAPASQSSAIAPGESRRLTVTCTSQSQECDATATVDGPFAPGMLTLTAPTTHCARVIYTVEFLSRGIPWRTLSSTRTRALGAGETARIETVTAAQRVRIGGIGVPGGCNTGTVGSFGVDVGFEPVP